MLEVEAARGAAGRIPADQLASLQDELLRLAAPPHDETWDQSARDLDTRLHGLIADCCGSRRLGAEVGRYLTLFRALRDVSHQRDAWTNYSRSNDVPEHLAIVEALVASDAEGAAQAMDRHIRSAAMALEEIIFSGPDAPVADRQGTVADGAPAPSPAGSSEVMDNGPGGREGRTGHRSKRSPRS